MASWQEKLDRGKPAHVEVTTQDFADVPAGSTMLIATPRIVDDYVCTLKPGKTVDMKQLRASIAKKFKASHMCPLTAGIFLRIVSEAAFESLQNGAKPESVTPFWRAVDPKSALAKNWPAALRLLQKCGEGNGWRWLTPKQAVDCTIHFISIGVNTN